MRDTLTGQPARGSTEHSVERLESALHRRPAVRPVTGQPHSHRDHILTNIDSSAPLVENLHVQSSFRLGSTAARVARGAPKHKLRDWYSRS